MLKVLKIDLFIIIFPVFKVFSEFLENHFKTSICDKLEIPTMLSI